MEKAIMTPSGKEYTGPKEKISKEVLSKTIEEVQKMDASAVKTKLGNYKDIHFNSKVTKETNTFEMTALYQRALVLLGKQVSIDARFNPETYTALCFVQEKILKMKGNQYDGLPGPKTTRALIEELGKSAVMKPVATAPIYSSAQDSKKAYETIKPAPTPTIRLNNILDPRSTEYVSPASAPIEKQTPINLANELLVEHGYVAQPDGTYQHRSNHTILKIDGNKIIATLNPKLSPEDQEYILALMGKIEILLNLPSIKK